MGAGQLQHLALGDHAGGAGQDLQRRHGAGLDHQLEGAGEQEVADQHAGRRAPDQVGGDLAAAQLRGVDHVVVQQGGGVDELDRRGQLQAPSPRAAGQARGGHGQQRAQPLAAGGDQVVGQRRDHRDRAVHARRGSGRRRAAMSGRGQRATRRVDGAAAGRAMAALAASKTVELLRRSDSSAAAAVAGDNGGAIGQGQGEHKAVECAMDEPMATSPKTACWTAGCGCASRPRLSRRAGRGPAGGRLRRQRRRSGCSRPAAASGAALLAAAVAAAGRRVSSGVERDPRGAGAGPGKHRR